MDPDITPQRPRRALGDLTQSGVSPVRTDPAPPCLVLINSSHPEAIGKALRLDREEMTIGRSNEASFSIEDPNISRLHARIAHAPTGSWVVSDLGSMNGTFLNGRLIATAELKPGDRLQLGAQTTLRFSLQEGLEDGEERLRRALLAAGVGTWEWEASSGAFVLSDTAQLLLWGAAVPASGVRDLWLMVKPEDRDSLRAHLERAIVQATSCEAECRLDSPSGERWVSLRGEVFRDLSGLPVRLAGTMMDVSQRKRAEFELRRQALMFDSLSDGVVVLDLEGRVLDWNAAARRLFGWEKSEVLGRTPEELFLPEGAREGLWKPMLAGVSASGRWACELALKRKQGGTCLVEVVAVPLRDAEGRPMACIAVHRDIGERRDLEARLHLAERLSSLGMLAAGMAHEINNPLAYVKSNLECAIDEADRLQAAGKLEPGSELPQQLREAHQGAERIRLVVQDLSTFSKRRESDLVEGVDVNRSMKFAVRIAENELKHRARLVLQLGEVPLARANEARLGQVFLNLIINAAQAIPAGAAERNEIRLGSRWDPARQRIILEVADTGSGIEQRHLQHVFEPFFTTRRASGGTGLGLSICHRIITGFGGEIGVESELGKGTRFEIALPAAPVADEAPTPADGATTLRRARVLIIDDEPLVGAAARRAVGAEHEVLVATRAAEALERIRAGERYDVILCDLMMPEITGAELHGLLSASNVDQARRMVFMTGAAFTEESRRFLEEGGRAWLSKPFVVDEVRAALARVLAARS